MNEIALTALSPATSAADVRNLLADARAHDVDTVVIAPHLLHAAGERPRVRIVSTAGWPTGNHHILVKCAEARLAVQCGASEIVLVPDLANLQDQNALIAEVVAVREAVPHPAMLIVALRAPDPAMVETARMAGADRLLILDAVAADLAAVGGLAGEVWALGEDEAALLDAGASKVLMERGA